MKSNKNTVQVRSSYFAHHCCNIRCFSVVLITIALVCSMVSCQNSSKGAKISEGEICYEIQYLDNERENPLIMILPTEMTTFFRNNSSYTIISGFMGNFKLIYLLAEESRKNYTLFQMMDKKYYYQAESNSLAFGYDRMKDMKISYTNKTKKIAGYHCKQAVASFGDKQCEDIVLYYTEDIELKDPNNNNPFHEINGVLMEFSINLLGTHMKFNAKKVYNKKVNPELFSIPKGFNKINLKEMEKIFKDLNLTSDK